MPFSYVDHINDVSTNALLLSLNRFCLLHVLFNFIQVNFFLCVEVGINHKTISKAEQCLGTALWKKENVLITTVLHSEREKSYMDYILGFLTAS